MNFILLLSVIWMNIKVHSNYQMETNMHMSKKNRIYMAGRVQLKSTKLQHRKRPRKRKKSEIYRTPVLYHPNQKDFFNLQSEYTCLPDEQILQLLTQNKLSQLIKAIKRKNDQEINDILYKDVNRIYLDDRYIYYDEKNEDSGKERDSSFFPTDIEETKFEEQMRTEGARNEEEEEEEEVEEEVEEEEAEEEEEQEEEQKQSNFKEKEKSENDFVDLHNVYYYFKKINITNINKDNIKEDIYKELVELKRLSIEKEDSVGYNIYKYFLNIIANVERDKYINDFFLVKFINNIWVKRNVHKYFYFLNSLFDRMKKISYKLFHLNYRIDKIGSKEEKQKMLYFERHELFNKVIKKTAFLQNYIAKHNYVYSNDIFHLYDYDVKTNTYINTFDKTYKREVTIQDFLETKKKQKLNIHYDPKKLQPIYEYANKYNKDNEMKKIMLITYGRDKSKGAEGMPQKLKEEKTKKEENETTVKEGKTKNTDFIEETNKSTNFTQEKNESKNMDTKIKENPELRKEILRKICEKMYQEFCEMKVIDEENKIDLNKIEDIKRDTKNNLYKKVYAMRDYFYNLFFTNYKPNLDIYELETYIDAEYRKYTYQKDLDILFKNWVLNENKQLPVVTFAKKDVEIAKMRRISKRKRKIQEFNELFQRVHGNKIKAKNSNTINTTTTNSYNNSSKGSSSSSYTSTNNAATITTNTTTTTTITTTNTSTDSVTGTDYMTTNESGGDTNDSHSQRIAHSSNNSAKNSASTKGKANKRSINCLIQWNMECESEFEKIKRDNEEKGPNDNNNNDNNNNKKKRGNNMDDYDENGDDEDFEEDFEKTYRTLPHFNKYKNIDQMDFYEFCDENDDEDLKFFKDSEDSNNSEDFDEYTSNRNYAKLVIYDDNYNKEAFIETLVNLINKCDFEKAEAIYNILKYKGKADNLYFKNFQTAENLAILLRQSKEKILADVQPLY